MSFIKRKSSKALGAGNRIEKAPFWYREAHPSLEEVTSDDSNELLGIETINLWDATEAQQAWGCVAVGRVVLTNGMRQSFKLVIRTNETIAFPVVHTEYYEDERTGKKFHEADLGDKVSAQVLRLFDDVFDIDYDFAFEALNEEIVEAEEVEL